MKLVCMQVPNIKFQYSIVNWSVFHVSSLFGIGFWNRIISMWSNNCLVIFVLYSWYRQTPFQLTFWKFKPSTYTVMFIMFIMCNSTEWSMSPQKRQWYLKMGLHYDRYTINSGKMRITLQISFSLKQLLNWLSLVIMLSWHRIFGKKIIHPKQFQSDLFVADKVKWLQKFKCYSLLWNT